MEPTEGSPQPLSLNPLCGTGTTGVAAVRLGRRFIGADKDRAGVSLAVERLSVR
jgi:site-specific DNA-methyltransferase (adenine-specific)